MKKLNLILISIILISLIASCNKTDLNYNNVQTRIDDFSSLSQLEYIDISTAEEQTSICGSIHNECMVYALEIFSMMDPSYLIQINNDSYLKQQIITEIVEDFLFNHSTVEQLFVEAIEIINYNDYTNEEYQLQYDKLFCEFDYYNLTLTKIQDMYIYDVGGLLIYLSDDINEDIQIVCDYFGNYAAVLPLLYYRDIFQYSAEYWNTEYINWVDVLYACVEENGETETEGNSENNDTNDTNDTTNDITNILIADAVGAGAGALKGATLSGVANVVPGAGQAVFTSVVAVSALESACIASISAGLTAVLFDIFK